MTHLFLIYDLGETHGMFATIVDTVILNCLLAVVLLIERISIMHQLMLASITTFVFFVCRWCLRCRHRWCWLHGDQGWHCWCFRRRWCRIYWLWNLRRQGWSFKLKFHLDLPSYRLSTNSTHSFGVIFNYFLKKWEEVNSVTKNTVQDSTSFLIFLKRREKYST